MTKPHQPPDDESSAPESGTVRDDTTGTKNSPPDRGPAPATESKDDPSRANEEK